MAPDATQAYRDMIGDALADGRIDAVELNEMHAARDTLKVEIARYVHASIYHRCLGAVLDDNKITDAELDELSMLHDLFAMLGWAVGMDSLESKTAEQVRKKLRSGRP